ncbi:hypothetical protein GCM10027563_47890 [Parasphingorhabdus pacifica]
MLNELQHSPTEAWNLGSFTATRAAAAPERRAPSPGTLPPGTLPPGTLPPGDTATDLRTVITVCKKGRRRHQGKHTEQAVREHQFRYGRARVSATAMLRPG